MCGKSFNWLSSSKVYYFIFQVQKFATDISWKKLSLQICDILSKEIIQFILNHYKLDHMK